MTKTDKSKHNISIAAIKKATIKPYDFQWTKFYNKNSDFNYSGLKLDLQENELIICSTLIGSNNYSILTTQKLITNLNGQVCIADMNKAKDKRYGDFKGYRDKKFTFGLIELENGDEFKYFIESGYASMVMIYGVRTLIRTQDMTMKNIENSIRNWNIKNEKNGK